MLMSINLHERFYRRVWHGYDFGNAVVSCSIDIDVAADVRWLWMVKWQEGTGLLRGVDVPLWRVTRDYACVC